MSKLKQTQLVALIGIDSAGKSTQVDKLATHYSRLGLRVATTALVDRPTHDNVLRTARRIDPEPLDFPFGLRPEYFAFALYCDFFNHYCRNLVPLLNGDHDLVLSDRYRVCYDAYAYAVGTSCNFARKMLDDLVRDADLEVYLEVDVDTALQRAESRPGGRSVDETASMLNSLTHYYAAYSRRHPEVAVVNARQPVDALTACIVEALDRRIL